MLAVYSLCFAWLCPSSPPRRNYEITPRTPSASRDHHLYFSSVVDCQSCLTFELLLNYDLYLLLNMNPYLLLVWLLSKLLNFSITFELWSLLASEYEPLSATCLIIVKVASLFHDFALPLFSSEAEHLDLTFWGIHVQWGFPNYIRHVRQMTGIQDTCAYVLRFPQGCMLHWRIHSWFKIQINFLEYMSC